ncbi:hypothetical protein HDZ31DRAFT_81474 [Schizophyllum fasciatum]
MSAWDDAAGYMRVAAMSIFIYDWIITLPGELNILCLIEPSQQYLALVALVTNLIGFFSRFFVQDPHGTDVPCRHFASVMPIMQCLAAWASHAVFVVRTVAICNNERLILITFTLLAIVVSGVELFSLLWSYKFDVGPEGNCILRYDERSKISYVYYLAATLFDFAVLAVTYHALAVVRGSGLFDFLWHSSVAYFCVTAVVNVNNMIFYVVFSNNHETMLCAMGIAITGMMSARVILETQERARLRKGSRHMRQLPSVDRRTPPLPVIDIRRQSDSPDSEESLQRPQPPRQMTCESTYANSLYLPQVSGLYRMSSRSTANEQAAKHDSGIGVLEPAHIRPSMEKTPTIRDASHESWRPPASAAVIVPSSAVP